MVLSCIYIYTYWSHVYTDLGDTIGKHWLRERIEKYWLRERMRNTWCMNPMSPMCSYNYGEILGSGWFHEGCLSHGSHISHESCVVINISNMSDLMTFEIWNTLLILESLLIFLLPAKTYESSSLNLHLLLDITQKFFPPILEESMRWCMLLSHWNKLFHSLSPLLLKTFWLICPFIFLNLTVETLDMKGN